ncbi:MAG TPA: DNA polymerase III subunit beta [Desulfobacteraceae bacterium]|nr:DNA polymerase III subunit beta [Desulfobacteraceae bacterium]
MNNPFGISDKSFEILLNIMKSYPQIEEAFIFGSRAKGNYKHGSDIDIALKGEKLSNDIIWDITALLNNEMPIPYKTDVLAVNDSLSSGLADHIRRVGISFYRVKGCLKGDMFNAGNSECKIR